MEGLKQTINSVLKRILKDKFYKFEIAEKIKNFYESRGFSRSDFDVVIKRKYIYIRVKNPYERQEMSLMLYDLEGYLGEELSRTKEYEIKFTGRL